jgi:hypothetical protein
LLRAQGVRSIEASNLCTACNTDLFYSHRAEGGKTGRFAVVAYLKPRDGDRKEAPLVGLPQATPAPQEPVGFESLSPPGFPSFVEMMDLET